jgi:hypothetical protein
LLVIIEIRTAKYHQMCDYVTPSISAMCRFVGSEVDLDEEVKKLHALSAAPVSFTFADKLHLSAFHGQ